jgi:hypothetical protein
LKPEGYVVFDATGTGLLSLPDATGKQTVIPENDWPRYYHTVKSAGYQSITPYVTTLEFHNKQAEDLLLKVFQKEGLNAEVNALLAQAPNPYERDALLRRVLGPAISEALIDHSLALQQGFIMMGNTPDRFNSPYQTPKIELDVLNQRRFDLAFEVVFPRAEEADDRYVNSIFRPTFPTLPIFQPRLPF